MMISTVDTVIATPTTVAVVVAAAIVTVLPFPWVVDTTVFTSFGVVDTTAVHRVIKCVSFIKHQLTRSVIIVQYNYFKGFGLCCEFKREERIICVVLISNLKLFLAIWNVCLIFALVDAFARRPVTNENTYHGPFLSTL